MLIPVIFQMLEIKHITFAIFLVLSPIALPCLIKTDNHG